MFQTVSSLRKKSSKIFGWTWPHVPMHPFSTQHSQNGPPWHPGAENFTRFGVESTCLLPLARTKKCPAGSGFVVSFLLTGVVFFFGLGLKTKIWATTTKPWYDMNYESSWLVQVSWLAKGKISWGTRRFETLVFDLAFFFEGWLLMSIDWQSCKLVCS